MATTTNVQIAREGDILTLTIDLAQEHGRSKRGATMKVASTGGWISVPGPNDGEEDERIILNLNCNKRDAE